MKKKVTIEAIISDDAMATISFGDKEMPSNQYITELIDKVYFAENDDGILTDVKVFVRNEV